jgi:hypothetical protein
MRSCGDSNSSQMYRSNPPKGKTIAVPQNPQRIAKNKILDIYFSLSREKELENLRGAGFTFFSNLYKVKTTQKTSTAEIKMLIGVTVNP